MIYLKNTTDSQTIWIPKNEYSGNNYHACSGAYNKGVAEGKEIQKAEDDNKLTSFVATENGHYYASYGYRDIEVAVPQSTGGGGASLSDFFILYTKDTHMYCILKAFEDGKMWLLDGGQGEAKVGAIADAFCTSGNAELKKKSYNMSDEIWLEGDFIKKDQLYTVGLYVDFPEDRITEHDFDDSDIVEVYLPLWITYINGFDETTEKACFGGDEITLGPNAFGGSKSHTKFYCHQYCRVTNHNSNVEIIRINYV